MEALRPTDVLVVGASGHAKVLIDAMRTCGRLRPVGLVDDRLEKGGSVLGCPLLGTLSSIDSVLQDIDAQAVVIAIGDNFVRHRISAQILEVRPSVEFPAIVHAKAYVAQGVKVGAGSVVLAGAVIGVDAQVGRFCILNTNSSLDHDGSMEDFSSIAPGVAAGGGVRLGAFSAVGIGASLNHGVSVGSHTVVGSGAVVTSSVPGGVVAYGVPAKVVRTRQPGDKYL